MGNSDRPSRRGQGPNNSRLLANWGTQTLHPYAGVRMGARRASPTILRTQSVPLQAAFPARLARFVATAERPPASRAVWSRYVSIILKVPVWIGRYDESMATRKTVRE